MSDLIETQVVDMSRPAEEVFRLFKAVLESKLDTDYLLVTFEGTGGGIEYLAVGLPPQEGDEYDDGKEKAVRH